MARQFLIESEASLTAETLSIFSNSAVNLRTPVLVGSGHAGQPGRRYTQGGIWPHRDATSPYILARDRGYDEILDAILAAEKMRGARGPGSTEAIRKMQQAYMTGSEDAMVAVYDQHPELGQMGFAQQKLGRS